MFFILKFTISFAISFLILSFPVGDTTIFQGISKVTSPYTSRIFSIISKNSKEVAAVTKDASKKIFDNTKPTISDEVAKQASSVQKNVEQMIDEAPVEDYTHEERQMLEAVLKKGRP